MNGPLKIACIPSSSPKAVGARDELAANYSFFAPEEADVIVALGGDGHLLHCLHETASSNIPIYGMNRGTVGFLLNAFDADDLEQRIAVAEEVVLHPLLLKATTRDGARVEAIAFNEVSLIRHGLQSANLRLVIDGDLRLGKLVCDGVLIATPAGSTAYNFSARGPILPLGANLLSLVPVSPFRPRRWTGALLPNTAVIQIENLDPDKRPLGVAADSREYTDVVMLTVRQVQDRGRRLLFDPGRSLRDRIFGEQFEI